MNINFEDDGYLEPITFPEKPNTMQVKIQTECEELAALLIKKNHDYGNSVQEQFEEYGLASILIRVDDKIRRLKNLMNNPQQVKDESILDTIKDLAGYAVLGSICLQIKKENQLEYKKPAYADLDD